MPKTTSSARQDGQQHKATSSHEQRERRQRVLNKNEPAVVETIAGAVVVKDGEVFFLCDADGAVPVGGNHGFGLYYHDCRFVCGYTLDLAGKSPHSLVASANRGYMAVIQLSNPDIELNDGSLLKKESVGIEWRRVIDGEHLVLHDTLEIQNFSLDAVELPIRLTFQAKFEDIFDVRGLIEEHPGTLHTPRWQDNILHMRYDGADGLTRLATVRFDPAPDVQYESAAEFRVPLDARGTSTVEVVVSLQETDDPDDRQQPKQPKHDFPQFRKSREKVADAWINENTRVDSSSLLLDQIIERSLHDLNMLRTSLEGQSFFAAGVPWFVTLFGRDSLITALETLAFHPQIAEQTLRVLASYQGTEKDDSNHERPGKIIHDVRVGELARIGVVPNPYYGTVDATLLFLILLGRHAQWSGSLAVFHDLRDNVEAALRWLHNDADSDGDGYVDYRKISGVDLQNQGWKDSGDAIVNADGSLSEDPIALIEVQGYAWLARLLIADLFERDGQGDRASQLRQEAADLRERFNRDYWLDDEGFYALALQRGGRPCAVRSSNPGQALWTGIVDADKVDSTVRMLMADDMDCGWGIRTLSSRARRYNPIGYHIGAVWPHDNAIIAAGFREQGHDAEALKITDGLLNAAMRFDLYRLPEVFAGYSRQDYGVPVHYPVACHPQAWAAGAVPYLIETLLGLQPHAFEKTLRIVRPVLPDFVTRIQLHGLTVGQSQVDLAFERTSHGKFATEVMRVDGDLDVVVEPAHG
jgi:glycogen debranching enzyme